MKKVILRILAVISAIFFSACIVGTSGELA